MAGSWVLPGPRSALSPAHPRTSPARPRRALGRRVSPGTGPNLHRLPRPPLGGSGTGADPAARPGGTRRRRLRVELCGCSSTHRASEHMVQGDSIGTPGQSWWRPCSPPSRCGRGRACRSPCTTGRCSSCRQGHDRPAQRDRTRGTWQGERGWVTRVDEDALVGRAIESGPVDWGDEQAQALRPLTTFLLGSGRELDASGFQHPPSGRDWASCQAATARSASLLRSRWRRGTQWYHLWSGPLRPRLRVRGHRGRLETVWARHPPSDRLGHALTFTCPRRTRPASYYLRIRRRRAPCRATSLPPPGGAGGPSGPRSPSGAIGPNSPGAEPCSAVEQHSREALLINVTVFRTPAPSWSSGAPVCTG